MEHWSLLRWIVFTYMVLTISHFVLECTFAHLGYLRQKRRYFIGREEIENLYESGKLPHVSVVIPVFNETPELVRQMLASIQVQRYPDCQIFVVNDGPYSPDVKRVYDELARVGTVIIDLPTNQGKRRAMRAGFAAVDETFRNRSEEHPGFINGEFTVTMDSDTFVDDPDAVLKLVYPFLVEGDELGAVTGEVNVANMNTNTLTRLIGLRYWSAFNQERASQSYFGIMMCCSGPFSAYRTSLLREVQDAFVDQQFLGEECTYGDDRHLTNLILGLGYEVRYTHLAKSYTHVPEALFWNYLRQQLRWNKSFYREILWNARFAHRRHPFMAFELAMQLVLPPLLMVMIVAMVVETVTGNPAVALRYAVVIAAVGVVRSTYGFLRTKDRRFAIFIIYGFIHVGLLIPTRLAALLTLRSNSWLTRGGGKIKVEA